MIGVALGVTALTSVTSVINGFRGELAKVVTSVNGEVLLFTRGEPISDPTSLMEKVQKLVPEVKTITPSLITEGMVANGENVAGSVIEGVDPIRVLDVLELRNRIVSGVFPGKSGEILLAKELANRLKVKVGEGVQVLLPETRGEGSERSALPQVQEFVVSGIAELGMYDYNSKYAYLRLDDLQSALKLPNQVTTFKMKVGRADPKKVADRLSELFGYPFRAKEWSSLNRNLLYSIELEKIVISIILFAIIIVAAFNVVSSLIMMLHEKTREISILKAMGFKGSQNFRLFLVIGGMIGGGGAILGTVVGLALSLFIGKANLLRLPPDVYYLSRIPVEIRPLEIVLIVIVSLLITVVASFFPAWRVAKQSPLEGIRSE